MHMGGAALCKAVEAMLAKGRAIAARLLQASVEQVVFADGRFAVRDEPDRAIGLLAVARAARDPANLPDGMSPGLDTYVWNLLDLITFPNGCHIAEVEVDPETGESTLERYTAVDDFGTLINPMLTLGTGAGRRRAGYRSGDAGAYGVRSALRPDAQRLVHGLHAAARQRSAGLDITLRGVPTDANPLGVKGSGQAGRWRRRRRSSQRCWTRWRRWA